MKAIKGSHPSLDEGLYDAVFVSEVARGHTDGGRDV